MPVLWVLMRPATAQTILRPSAHAADDKHIYGKRNLMTQMKLSPL